MLFYLIGSFLVCIISFIHMMRDYKRYKYIAITLGDVLGTIFRIICSWVSLVGMIVINWDDIESTQIYLYRKPKKPK